MKSKSTPAESKPDVAIRGSARRRRTIDAAAAVFARNGFHGTGTRDIAESLGIKVASLYFHVASKEEALAEICQFGIDHAQRCLRVAVEGAEDLDTRIRLYFAQQREDFENSADYISVYIRELRHLPEHLRQHIDDCSRTYRKGLDDMFSDAARRNELHPSLTPRSASLFMIGVIRNLSHLYVDGPIRNYNGFLADSVDILLRGISAPPSGTPAAKTAQAKRSG